MIWYAGAILILLFALLFKLSLLAYAMYALLGVLLVSRWLTRSWAASLSAKRQVDKLAAEVGDTISVELTIENAGKLPIAWVLLEDLLPRGAIMYDPPSLAVTGRRIELTMMKPRGIKTMLYQLKCNRRGYYQIGPLVLETGDLFGLHRRYRVATEPHYLMVLPKVMPLAGYEVVSKRPIGEVRMTYRLFEDPTRIAGVRAYERGDPLNRVNWKATARTGQLHSKVYEPSTVIGATILLDFHKASHSKSGEPHRSELAITAAASIANAVYLMGQQIGLVTNGRDAADRIRTEGWTGDTRTRAAAKASAGMKDKSDRLQPLLVPTRRGPEQLMQILETLARVELTDGLSLPQLIVESTSRMPRDASVIVILPKVTMETAIALGELRRQGYAITAVINTYEQDDFAHASGPLLAYGIPTRHLQDENAVVEVCRQYVLR